EPVRVRGGRIRSRRTRGCVHGGRRCSRARRTVARHRGKRRLRTKPMTPMVETPSRWQIAPAAPISLDEAGLSLDLMVQLVTKTLHFAGELTGSELAHRLGVLFPIVEPALDELIGQRQCEIVGGTVVSRASYRYRITDAGRARAMLFLRDNQYVGVAPVPL